MTIRDIARRLRIAPSTVSRAINRRAGVGSARRDEILSLVAAEGFVPRPRRRSGLARIGLVMVTDAGDAPDNDYIGDVLIQSQRLAQRESFALVPMFLHRGRQATSMPAAVAERTVDGVLVAGHPSPDLCRRLLATGLPTVALHDTSARTGCHSVFESKFQAVSDAMRRLIALGHRRVGIVLADPAPPSVDSFIKAYEQTLAEHGTEAPSAWRSEGTASNLLGGAQGTRALLQRRQELTAIIYENDRMALGGMLEMARHGVRVPQDVSIVGSDNDPLCIQVEPALTTVDIRLDRSLDLAWSLLGQLASRRRARREAPDAHRTQLVIAADLVWRDSCVAPRRAPAQRLLSP